MFTLCIVMHNIDFSSTVKSLALAHHSLLLCPQSWILFPPPTKSPSGISCGVLYAIYTASKSHFARFCSIGDGPKMWRFLESLVGAYFDPTKRKRNSCSPARTITTSPYIIKSALARFFNRLRWPVQLIRMPRIGPRVGLLYSYRTHVV